MNKNIQYIEFEEALDIYQKTILASGGGFSGVRDEGGIRSVLDFCKNDLYYPSVEDKIVYLVFRFCSGHFFSDGNKRIALTIATAFLHKNQYYWQACAFMKKMEAFVYHIAANKIDELLLKEIICCFMQNKDYDEPLKIKIAEAMSQGNNFEELENDRK